MGRHGADAVSVPFSWLLVITNSGGVIDVLVNVGRRGRTALHQAAAIAFRPLATDALGKRRGSDSFGDYRY
jgi:hypothetical protein